MTQLQRADRAADHDERGTSHEGDLMKAVEWATAAAKLRSLADKENV